MAKVILPLCFIPFLVCRNNVLVHAEEIFRIKLCFQCRQACIVCPVSFAHRLCAFPFAERVHVQRATGPRVDRTPSITRPLHMQGIFRGVFPLCDKQEVEVRFAMRKRRGFRRNAADCAAVVFDDDKRQGGWAAIDVDGGLLAVIGGAPKTE